MSDICPCGRPHHPKALEIPPGLTHLVRYVGDFASFRAAMLADASGDTRLATWTAREPNDLGVLLLEMWSGACAVVAFADETNAHESYLRTARQQQSVEHLVELLGVRRRGAVGAVAELSFRARGRQPVMIPAGTAVRSGAVDEHPPQIFELLTDVTVHPLTNRFTVAAQPAPTVGDGSTTTELSELRVIQHGAGVQRGMLAKVAIAGATSFVTIGTAVAVREPGPTRIDVTFTTPLSVPAGTMWGDIEFAVSDRRHSLWTLDVGTVTQTGIESSGGATTLILDVLSKDFSVGDEISISRGADHRWFEVAAVASTTRRLTLDSSYTVDGNDYTVPGALVPVTTLTLDATIDDPTRRTATDTTAWTDVLAGELTVLGRWRRVATPVIPTATSVDAGVGSVPLDGPLDQPMPGHDPQRFVLVDLDGRAVASSGLLDWAQGEVELDVDQWDPPLRHPINIDANVATATRGETVRGEVLGGGDAAMINQRFELANGPVTHLGPDATGGGALATSTLIVRVDGLEWAEVPSFVRAGPIDRVYATELTDDGGLIVVFGDGVAGARLPTGTANITADYRFGAGAIHPGPGSVVSMVEPLETIAGVTNRSAAFGGADPQRAEDLRVDGPPSALLLDRTISIVDFEAAVAAAPGVVATSASYEWEPDRLRSAVVIRFIGDPSLAAGLNTRLSALAERNTPITVVPSPPYVASVQIHVAVDPNRLEADVLSAVSVALLEGDGALTPGVLGVDGALVRSRLLAAIMAVEGVDHVIDLSVDHVAFIAAAIRPDPGTYFDLVDNTEIIAGEAQV